jgi:phosphoribosylformylglycinamidine cyclo-ligase
MAEHGTGHDAGKAMDYRSAGVDLEKAERAKEGIRGLLEATRDRWTLSELGAFGGLYQVPDDVPEPVLVSSADGVGTKLKLAFRTGVHHTVGQDLVNHCVNDILVQGARPLFFLDYLATGELEEGVVEEVVRGIAEACRENGCALLGGETAQMPDFYGEGEYDLAGFIVGIVSRRELLDGSRVQEGDALIGLPSSGLHTNGYTLARRIVFDGAGLGVEDAIPGLGEPVGTALLRVHRSYFPALAPELERGRIRAMAHITGGGLPGNLPRVLPRGLSARIDRASWRVPDLFTALQRLGSVAEEEMFRVFNMGVGMVLVVSPAEAPAVVQSLRDRGEGAWIVGEVGRGEGVTFDGEAP